jgi:hypothetical protein
MHYATRLAVASSRHVELKYILFLIYLTLSAALAVGFTLPRTEMISRRRKIIAWAVDRCQCLGLTAYRRLWADWLENLGCMTSHNPIVLHDLLWGYLWFVLFYLLNTQTVHILVCVCVFVCVWKWLCSCRLPTAICKPWNEVVMNGLYWVSHHKTVLNWISVTPL